MCLKHLHWSTYLWTAGSCLPSTCYGYGCLDTDWMIINTQHLPAICPGDIFCSYSNSYIIMTIQIERFVGNSAVIHPSGTPFHEQHYFSCCLELTVFCIKFIDLLKLFNWNALTTLSVTFPSSSMLCMDGGPSFTASILKTFLIAISVTTFSQYLYNTRDICYNVYSLLHVLSSWCNIFQTLFPHLESDSMTTFMVVPLAVVMMRWSCNSWVFEPTHWLYCCITPLGLQRKTCYINDYHY